MKQDRPAVSVVWVSSFTYVTLVLLLLITGGVSASKIRSWHKYPDVNPWAIGSPSPRDSHTMVVGSDGALWSFGGELGSRKSAELFKLDVQTKEWKTITTSGVTPTARSDHTMGSTDGYLWVFGGATRSGEGEERIVCCSTSNMQCLGAFLSCRQTVTCTGNWKLYSRLCKTRSLRRALETESGDARMDPDQGTSRRCCPQRKIRSRHDLRRDGPVDAWWRSRRITSW